MSRIILEPQESDTAPRAEPHRSDATVRSLIRTYGLLRRVMEPHFGQFGISGSQWAVLRALHRAAEAGEPSLRLSELGDRVLVRPPSVTGVVDRLQKIGLIARETSPDDARAKQVSLTDAGRALVARVSRGMPERVESILSDLAEGDRRALRRMLEIVSTRLEALCAESSASDGDSVAATPASRSTRTGDTGDTDRRGLAAAPRRDAGVAATGPHRDAGVAATGHDTTFDRPEQS